MEVFDAAIFFDNDQGYLDDVKAKCPEITLNKVNDTLSNVKYSYKNFTYMKNNLPIRSRSLTPGPLKDLIDSLYEEPTYNNENYGLKNTFVSYLLHFKIIPKYHPESGLSRDDINKYYEWEGRTKGNRVLLLDWDQTLTQFDGIELPGDNLFKMFLGNSPRGAFLQKLFIKPQDIAIFYLGGLIRYTMITDWLKDVANSGVHIIVLTNNGGANDIIFKQVVDEIIPKDSYDIIASVFPPSYGNKGKALLADPRFRKLCPKTGGKRGRRQTRRRKSRKQKNIHSLE